MNVLRSLPETFLVGRLQAKKFPLLPAWPHLRDRYAVKEDGELLFFGQDGFPRALAV